MDPPSVNDETRTTQAD